MSNYIFVYPIANEEELARYRNYKEISPDPENFDRCIHRERYKEIEYFSKTNQVIFWNKRYFTNTRFRHIKSDLSDKIIFPRVSVEQYSHIVRDIYKEGWTPISNPYQYKMIELWGKTIPHDFLKRKIIITTKEHASNEFSRIHKQVANSYGQFFIKSIVKDFHYAGSVEGWIDTGMALSLENGSAYSLVMFSEYLLIKFDDKETLEYRCYYLNGKLSSISRYFDYEEHKPPKEIVDYAKFIEKSIIGKYLPKNVVVDLVDTECRGIIILEANDVCSSGRYSNNKLECFLKEN